MKLPERFRGTEQYMLDCMRDATHDREHVYRVINYALDIAAHERGADLDVLVTAALLHDIGRAAQFADARIDHAAHGAGMAREWLLSAGRAPGLAEAVHACIATHRFRSGNPPASAEARILFDADKVDVCGAVGIARTLTYCGQVSRPLYTFAADGGVSDGSDGSDSFLGEYKFKLESIYGRFYTARGAELARARQAAAIAFYESIYAEVRDCHENGAANWAGAGLA
jgi:uncharacterized protein